MDKKSLGDYTIIKQIGQGCLGAVFLAEHRFIKKHFALKVLSEDLAADKGFVMRFEKDMAALAQLEHPNIVKIHNVSFYNGYYFVVMDCVVDALGETTNLADYLKVHHAKIQEGEILNILSQIAAALDYAHQKKIGDQNLIHRGLKLNNILIGGKKDGSLHVSLSDFGLSYILGEPAILTKTYKNLSETLGLDIFSIDLAKFNKLQAAFLQNYAFLAPEQKQPFAKGMITSKTDVYAFGVLAYYLLMKCFPEGLFPMPSKACLHLQLDWDQLLIKCLGQNPSTRAVLLLEVINHLKNSAKAKILSAEQQQAYALQESSEISFAKKPSTLVANSSGFNQCESAAATAVMEPAPFVDHAQDAHEPKPILNPTEIKRPVYEDDPAAVFQLESTIARYIPQQKEIKDTNPLLTDMVMIPAGEYFRGSNTGGRDERPKHLVRVEGYALDIHPVTNEQFVRFLEVMGGEKDANNNDIIRLRESRIKRLGGKLIIESGYAKHPVVGVSWYGATAYAKWVGKRLPTEAEWEMAASSGFEDMIFPTGSQIERTQANFFSADTVNVMSYPPNRFGLYDMAGNVYEWCQDWYDYTYYEHSCQEPENPKGPLQGVYRVLRGGCWKSLHDDLRCAHRHRNNPGTINKTYGFRCAADVK
jgi:formylglycine-generating enzyme required for sulfatase activity